jgi:hypothetical protein
MALDLLARAQRHELKRPDADLAEVSNHEVARIHQPSIMTTKGGRVRDSHHVASCSPRIARSDDTRGA